MLIVVQREGIVIVGVVGLNVFMGAGVFHVAVRAEAVAEVVRLLIGEGLVGQRFLEISAADIAADDVVEPAGHGVAFSAARGELKVAAVFKGVAGRMIADAAAGRAHALKVVGVIFVLIDRVGFAAGALAAFKADLVLGRLADHVVQELVHNGVDSAVVQIALHVEIEVFAFLALRVCAGAENHQKAQKQGGHLLHGCSSFVACVFIIPQNR